MRVGLVGFSGGGKSTLFELLTGARPDPGKVHGGQVGIATLSDPRLDFLAALHKPKKVTPATVEMLDTPGLMPGSHGDNPQRLALIREGDALLIVLGAFAGGDPAADLAAFRDEMLFADLGVVTNRADRLEASVKKPRPNREQELKELEIVNRVKDALEAGEPIASLELTEEDKKPMRSFGLLTDKPQVVLVNLTQGNEVPASLLAAAPTPWRSTPSWSWSFRNSTPPSATPSWPTWRSSRWAATGSSDGPTTRWGSSRFSRPASPRSGAGTSSAGVGRRRRREDPYRPGQGVHPGRGHGLRRPGPARHHEGGQGQEPPAPRRQGVRRQGRRHHVLPERALSRTSRDQGVRKTEPGSTGASTLSRRSRLAAQSLFRVSPSP